MTCRPQRLHQRKLPGGSYPAEYGVLFRSFRKLLIGQQRYVGVILRAGKPCLCRHVGYRHRVVAGYHADIHALRTEVLQGGGRALPYLVGKHHQRSRNYSAGERLVRQRLAALRQEKHAHSPGGVLLALLPDGGILVSAEDEAGRAQNQRAIFLELRRAPFPRGGKRLRLYAVHVVSSRESAGDCRHGLVLRPQRPGKRRQRRLRREIRVQADYLAKLHVSGGYRSGLVKAEDVHPGKAFHTVQILAESTAARKPYGAHRQRDTRQQNKPLGDHSDYCGGSTRHAVLKLLPGNEQRLCEQHQRKRQDTHGYRGDYLVDGVHHVRTALSGFLGACRNLVRVCRRSDRCRFRLSAAGYHKASGIQRVPRALHYRVAFAGQQALICLQLAGHENPVRTELPAGGKKHDIPRDKVRNRKHLLLAVPQ